MRLRPGFLLSATLLALIASCAESPATAEPTGPDGQWSFAGGTVRAGQPEPGDIALSGEVAGTCSTEGLPARLVEVGEAFAPDGLVDDDLGWCNAPLWRGVASRQMRLEARLTLADPFEGARLHRLDAHALNGDGVPIETVTTFAGEATIVFSPDHTGEYGLAVAAVGATAEPSTKTVDYRLQVVCLSGCEAGMTRYPIVLLHGMGGTDAFLDLVDYFLGVEEALEEAGFDVHTTIVDPLASSDVRAEQLVPQLEAILAETGARRVNLIGHSQGGIDGRALIVQQEHGDRVASITTIATPHQGNPLADILAGLVEGTELGEQLVDEVGDVYGQILGRDTDQSFPTALRQVGERYIVDTFNPLHPNDPRVAYYSWAGRTCAAAEIRCRDQLDGELVNPVLAAPYRAMQIMGVEQSDGLVGVESAQWGTYLGVLPADHLAEVGLRVDSPFESWEHLEFFVAEGDRLFVEGH